MLLSFLAVLVGGPVGSIAAIVFGWAARHESSVVSPSPRRQLALLGMSAGFVFACMWAILLGRVANLLELRVHVQEEVGLDKPEPNDAPGALPVLSASSAGGVEKESHGSRTTITHREGAIIVVDVGTLVPSLSEELAKQRAEAALTGEKLLVMTTRTDCSPCRHFWESLRHPLMQTALVHVRLARIDVDAFEEDLSNMKIPHEQLPGFFLLAPDLYPSDGIDAGEWTPDSVKNVAPVIDAFVRGKYATRHRAWQPVTENRLRL